MHKSYFTVSFRFKSIENISQAACESPSPACFTDSFASLYITSEAAGNQDGLNTKLCHVLSAWFLRSSLQEIIPMKSWVFIYLNTETTCISTFPYQVIISLLLTSSGCAGWRHHHIQSVMFLFLANIKTKITSCSLLLFILFIFTWSLWLQTFVEGVVRNNLFHSNESDLELRFTLNFRFPIP